MENYLSFWTQTRTVNADDSVADYCCRISLGGGGVMHGGVHFQLNYEVRT